MPMITWKTTRLGIAFFKYHDENPQIYDLFLKFTFQVIASGRESYSVDGITHRMRWYAEVESHDPDGFKINNNHRAYYARLFMEQYPQYDGFFRTRHLVNAGNGPLEQGELFVI